MSDKQDGKEDTGVLRFRTSTGCGLPCMVCALAAATPCPKALAPEEAVAALKECRAGTIIFEDCPIAGAASHTESILKAILAEEGLARRFRWEAAFRPDRLTEEAARALKALDVSRVTLWCMAGSEREIAELSGGTVSPSDIERALMTCRKFALPVHAFLFKGAPDTSRADLSETYEWVFQAAKRRLIREAAIDLLLPWPGTLLFEDALKRGTVAQSTTAEEVRAHWPRHYLARNLPQDELLCYDLLADPMRRLLEAGRKRTACVVCGQHGPQGRERAARAADNTYFDEVIFLAEGLPAQEERWDVAGHIGSVRALRREKAAPQDVALLGELAGRGIEVIYWLTGDEGTEDAVQALAWDHVMSGSDCTTWLDDEEGRRGLVLSAGAARTLGESCAGASVSARLYAGKELTIRRCAADGNLLLGRPVAERLLHAEMRRQWRLSPGESPFAAGAEGGTASNAEAVRLRDLLIRAQQQELLRLAATISNMKHSGAPGTPAEKHGEKRA